MSTYSARYEGSCSCGVVELSLVLHDVSADRMLKSVLTEPCVGCSRPITLALVELGSELVESGLRGPE